MLINAINVYQRTSTSVSFIINFFLQIYSQIGGVEVHELIGHKN